jgi:hypothetical protein
MRSQASAASYVLVVAEATASAAEGFRDACIEYGIPIEPGDLANDRCAQIVNVTRWKAS